MDKCDQPSAVTHHGEGLSQMFGFPCRNSEISTILLVSLYWSQLDRLFLMALGAANGWITTRTTYGY